MAETTPPDPTAPDARRPWTPPELSVIDTADATAGGSAFTFEGEMTGMGGLGSVTLPPS